MAPRWLQSRSNEAKISQHAATANVPHQHRFIKETMSVICCPGNLTNSKTSPSHATITIAIWLEHLYTWKLYSARVC